MTVNVLSLFDGKSSGYTALELAGYEVGEYYSAEIDKYAITVSDAIHPRQHRLGSVTDWVWWGAMGLDWASIDVVLAGFPCQAWSVAGKQQGDRDERGMLFWVMLDIMKHVRHYNPKANFLIENVKMKKEFEEYITYHTEQALGEVHKILINSALVSAQNRNRYYWTSFECNQPVDRGILVKDIIERSTDKKYLLSQKLLDGFKRKRERRAEMKSGFDKLNITNLHGKASCLTARYFKMSMSDPYIPTDDGLRKLTPRECFRLQTVPEHYIDKILACGASNSQLYKIAGNGWTDEVISHILKGMPL